MTTAQDRIVELADKVRRFKSEGVDQKLSEQDTKRVLLEPLLEIIGWDVLDPAQVRSEDRPTERPVDYSLKIRGEPVVLVECKRLANTLDSRKDLEQALAYAAAAGVRWSVLTNGCLLRIYNSLAPEKAENKLLDKVDLSMVGQTGGLPADRALQTLQLISPQSIDTGRIDEAWDLRYTGATFKKVVDELWSKPDPGLVNLVRQRMKESGRRLSKKETAGWLRSLDVKVEARSAPVVEGRRKRKSAGTLLRATRIRVGTYTDEIKYSYEILTKTAEWLIGQGKLRVSDCPVPTGRKRNLVNTEARHRDGAGFTAPRQLSNGLWLETHFSTKGCTRNAKRLLEASGCSTDILEVA